MADDTNKLLFDFLMFPSPYITFPIFVLTMLAMAYVMLKMKKYVKFYIAIETDRMMDDDIPYKVYMFWDGEFSKPEVRRFGLDKALIKKIKHLKAKLREVFPKLKIKSYTIAWKDEDDDEILVSTDKEVTLMLTTCNDAVIKLYVRCTGPKEADENDSENDVADSSGPSGDQPQPQPQLNTGIKCDECGCIIQGFRYKCVTCDDFDLCCSCETARKHPEHCVVRVPLHAMPLPLIKVSMKKSRKFLKSVASQSHEENKRLRREHRANKTMDAAASQGKPDHSQQRPRRTWVEVFGKYMEEFANLAGDVSRQAGMMTEAGTSPGAAEAGPSEPKGPTMEEITLNPWNLAMEDLEKLQHACKYVKDNALRASAKTINKVLEIAATVAEEKFVATSPPPMRANTAERTATSPDFAGPTMRSVSVEEAIRMAQATVKVAKEEADRAAQEAAKNVQEAIKIAQEEIKSAREGMQAATEVLTPQPQCSTSVACAAETENVQTNVSDVSETIIEKPEDEKDTEEIFIVKRSLKRSISSNASSASESPDRIEEWTVINDLKDIASDSDNNEMMGNCGSDYLCERLKTHAKIYPPLNTATAVLDPNGTESAANTEPSAPAAPQKENKPARANSPQAKSAPAKPAQAKPAQAKSAQPKAGQSKPAPANPVKNGNPPNYSSPHIEAAVEQMEAMGFSNEGGWLTQLLESNDGNIPKVIDLITPTNRG